MMKAFTSAVGACFALTFSLPAFCQTTYQMTFQNSAGDVVVCKSPDLPEFKDIGRVALLYWCSAACEAHGFKWIGRGRENIPAITDVDLGKKERKAVEKHLPAQCLPYTTGARGIIKGPDGGPLDCLGILFKDGKCPD